MGSNTFHQELGLSVSSRLISRTLHEDPNFQYKKMVLAPMILSGHILARENVLSEKLTCSLLDRYTAIWFDYKKLNLDGPDEFSFL